MTNSLVSSYPSLLIFLVITLLYFFLKYKIQSHSFIYYIIYILCIIGGELGSNIMISQSLCGSPQWNTVLIVTIIPWILVFTVLNLLLTIFPGWLIPFSNTFGYGIAKLAGLKEAFNNVLKANTGKGILGEIYEDQSLLINEIPNSTFGFEKFWEESQKGGILKSNILPEAKEMLRTKVKLKNIISELIWFVLTGILTVSVSYNYIIKSVCNNSVKDMEQKHKDYEEELIAEQEDTIPRRIYNITE